MLEEKRLAIAKAHVRVSLRSVRIWEDLFDGEPNEHNCVGLEKAEELHRKNLSVLNKLERKNKKVLLFSK